MNLSQKQEVVTPTVAQSLRAPVSPADKKAKFQHYKSAKSSMRLISTLGTKITFIHHEFITADPDAIDYLNTEIERGLPGITAGELLTSEEADPMAMLKKQLRAEIIQEIDARDNGAAKQDMGSTDPKAKVGAVSTSKMGGNAAGSS